MQQAFAVVWLLALTGLLVWSIRAGSRDLKLKPVQVINLSTEDVRRLADFGLKPVGAAAGD